MTKIQGFRTRIVNVPYREPVKHPFLGARTHNTVLVLEVLTNEGCTGVSFVAIQSARQIAALEQLVLDLEEPLRGLDPCATEYIFDLMWKLTVDLLHDGATNMALAVIDIALWDIKGKLADMPLWRLLGGSRRKVRAYGSDTLWRHLGPDRLQTDGAEMVANGFDAMKLRLGGCPMAQDVARAKALREAVGPDVLIMTDALWGLRPDDAVRLGQALEEYEIYWYEEPVREGDFPGLLHVRDKSPLPIAAGERISRLGMLEQLIPCIDHAILDVHHIGGITPFLKAAAILGARNLPISTHSSHEINLQLLAALPTGSWLEHLPRREVLFEDFPQIEEGLLDVGDRPGLGLVLNEDVMTKMAADR